MYELENFLIKIDCLIILGWGLQEAVIMKNLISAWWWWCAETPDSTYYLSFSIMSTVTTSDSHEIRRPVKRACRRTQKVQKSRTSCRAWKTCSSSHSLRPFLPRSHRLWGDSAEHYTTALTWLHSNVANPDITKATSTQTKKEAHEQVYRHNKVMDLIYGEMNEWSVSQQAWWTCTGGAVTWHWWKQPVLVYLERLTHSSPVCFWKQQDTG